MSTGSMVEEAEALERLAWGKLDWQWKEAHELARRALAVREAAQGPAHPDLIWPLSLMIAALLQEHRLERTREAAALGMRRLALQEAALHAFPAARAHAIRAQIALYSFELEVYDRAAVRQLEAVLRGYPDGR